jgi:hypothetical protein
LEESSSAKDGVSDSNRPLLTFVVANRLPRSGLSKPERITPPADVGSGQPTCGPGCADGAARARIFGCLTAFFQFTITAIVPIPLE